MIQIFILLFCGISIAGGADGFEVPAERIRFPHSFSSPPANLPSIYFKEGKWLTGNKKVRTVEAFGFPPDLTHEKLRIFLREGFLRLKEKEEGYVIEGYVPALGGGCGASTMNGAVAGATAGAAILGPPGAIIVGVIGAIAGTIDGERKERKEEQRHRENLEAMRRRGGSS